MQSVNLSASSFYVPSNNSMMYLNYGAAVSEVKCFLMHMSNLNGISSLKSIFFYVKYLKLSNKPYYWSNWVELLNTVVLNSGNYFSGGNRSSDRRNQISSNRYYLWLWTESQPCCGFRTGMLSPYLLYKLNPNQGLSQHQSIDISEIQDLILFLFQKFWCFRNPRSNSN
jgi:hypothetical protein